MKPKVESCACLLISKYSSTLFSKDGCPVSNHMNPSIFDHFKAPFFSFAIYVIWCPFYILVPGSCRYLYSTDTNVFAEIDPPL